MFRWHKEFLTVRSFPRLNFLNVSEIRKQILILTSFSSVLKAK